MFPNKLCVPVSTCRRRAWFYRMLLPTFSRHVLPALALDVAMGCCLEMFGNDFKAAERFGAQKNVDFEIIALAQGFDH